MANLSYSFCLSLLHSFWQAVLLWLVYVATSKILGTKFAPAQKRNLLFVSLTAQVVLFVITFCLYFFSYQPGSYSITYLTDLAGYITPKSAAGITSWLFTTYTIIIFYKLLKAVYNWWWFKKQFTTSLIKPGAELKLFAAVQQYRFGIKRKVELWLSNAINTPLTFGFLKPVIVLPVALVNQLSVQQTETLILHELAHIKANDFLLNWFVILAETIFFINPFILFICKQVKLEREKNCDITVTAFNYQPLLYAEALLKAQTLKQLAAGVMPSHNLRIAAVNKSHHLLSRIQFFVNPANQLQPSRKKIIFPIAAFLFSFAVALILTLELQTAATKQNSVTAASQNTYSAATDKMPVIANNILAGLTDENIKKIEAEVEKQKPAIEAVVKKMEPLLKVIEEKATKLAEEAETNIATPVSLQEPVIEKKIVIKEEASGSKNTTIKVYTVVYKDGKWLLQPKWKLDAKEIILTDSSTDTSNLQVQEEIQD